MPINICYTLNFISNQENAINAITRYHFIYIRLSNFNNSDRLKCCGRHIEMGTANGRCVDGSHFGKQCGDIQ